MQIIQKNNFKHINYNSNVDIIKGLSALLVLIYHLDLTIFGYEIIPNGYLGVDIFFTISGFLITDLIIKYNFKKNFRFKDFYLSRIKKLFPTALLVFFFISIAGWYFNLPYDYKYNAESIISFFKGDFNNFVSSIAYGGTAVLLKPTLHFWSLSTEIYFYIFFSIIFYFCLKFLKKKKSIIFLFLIFILNIILIYNFEFNFRENTDTYYFSFFRIYEFLVGSLFCLIFYRNNKKINSFYFDFLLILTIVLFLIFYDNLENHPHFYVLLLLVSICFLFYSEIFNIIENYLLIFIVRIFKYIGVISYSLYLWHYPILSFSRINNYFDSLLGIFFTIVFIFFISIVTFEFFEKRFKTIKNKYFINLTLLFLILLIVINIFIIRNDGYKERYNYINNIYQNYNIDNAFLNNQWREYQSDNRNYFKKNDKTKVLIIGDSHSQDTFNLFNLNKDLFTEYEFAQQDFYVLKKGEKLKYFELENKNNFKKSDVIMVSYKWSSRHAVINQIDEMIRFLKETNKKIIFLSNTNEYTRRNQKFSDSNLTIIDKELINKKKVQTLDLEKFLYDHRLVHANSKINMKIKEIAEKNNIQFLNKEDYLCDVKKNRCEFVTPDQYKIYWDYGHYTLEGAKYFGEKIFLMKWLKIN